jgi:hypothetical protein
MGNSRQSTLDCGDPAPLSVSEPASADVPREPDSLPEPLRGKDRSWHSYQGRPQGGQPFAKAEAPSGQGMAMWRDQSGQPCPKAYSPFVLGFAGKRLAARPTRGATW